MNSLWIKLGVLLVAVIASLTVGKQKEFLGSHHWICRFVVLLFCASSLEIFQFTMAMARICPGPNMWDQHFISIDTNEVWFEV